MNPYEMPTEENAKAREGDVTIAEWQQTIHSWAVSKGWWEDPDRNFGEMCMLMVTELAEAMEAWREDKPLVYVGKDGKPEGIAVEMADCVIRILDWAESVDLDLGGIISDKHAYNSTRPHRHGGKRA